MSGSRILKSSGWWLGIMLFSALLSAGWFACRQADSFVFPRPDLDRFRSSMVKVLSYCSPASQLGGLNQQPAAIITPAMELVREYHYRWCGHTETGKPSRDMLLVGLTAEQLKRLYPASEGWQVDFSQPNRVVMRLNLEQLCPVDAAKRHLGVVDGRVAIFIGPAGFNGALEKLTSISLAGLPPEWQEQLHQGTLEFGDAETLAQTLDSLDDYY